MHFPLDGSPAPLPGYDPRALDRGRSACPGCKHRRARNDWAHTREVGQRGYPYDHPEIWDCEACMNHWSRD
eukprot:15191460-Alexandrium_andersonii.AAC.1